MVLKKLLPTVYLMLHIALNGCNENRELKLKILKEFEADKKTNQTLERDYIKPLSKILGESIETHKDVEIKKIKGTKKVTIDLIVFYSYGKSQYLGTAGVRFESYLKEDDDISQVYKNDLNSVKKPQFFALDGMFNQDTLYDPDDFILNITQEKRKEDLKGVALKNCKSEYGKNFRNMRFNPITYGDYSKNAAISVKCWKNDYGEKSDVRIVKHYYDYLLSSLKWKENKDKRK